MGGSGTKNPGSAPVRLTKIRGPAPVYSKELTERESLLAGLTGIKASKAGHYRELKGKIQELQNSNEQLRQAKAVTERLYEQVSRNAGEITALYEKSLLQSKRLDWAIASLERISQVLTNTTQGVDLLAQSVVRTAAELFDTEYAVMTVGGKDCPEPISYCAYGSFPFPMPALPPHRLLELAGAAPEERRPILLRPPDGNDDDPPTLCVAMFREDLLVGHICLQCRKGHDFSENVLSILQTLANQAAVAIDNARLFEESQRLQVATSQLYELAIQQKEEAERKTLELNEARNEIGVMQKEQILAEERNRIARDLHDSVAQILISIGLNLEWCLQLIQVGSPIYERILSLKQSARNGVYEIRNTIFELWSSEIAELGLVPALDRVAKEFQRIGSIEADFTIVGDVRRLPLAVETALYRVSQEALYNVFKHADATHVDLELEFCPGEIRLRITDNGVGIDERAVRDSRQGFTYGLKTMLSRVEELNGIVEISNLSLDGGGTRVSARIPLEDV